MDFTEILNQAWVWVTSIVGSVSLSTILAFIFALVNSSKLKKALGEFRAEQIAELATDKGIDKIKSMSFKHDIQPIVESELKKVYEYSVAVLETELKVVKGQYAHLVSVVEALAKYFDNSIGVSEEAKEELKSAIAEAKADAEQYEPVDSTPVIEEAKQEIKETKVATAKASR